MERKVSLSQVFLVSMFAILVNLCYYFGILSTFKFCVSGFLYSVYALLVFVTLFALVASIGVAATSATTEVTWGSGGSRQSYPTGWLFKESLVVSVIAVAVCLFVGNASAVFAEMFNLGFPSAELLRFENLFPVFWKPYLASYAISFLFAILLLCYRKYSAHKRKKGKKNQVVHW